MGLLNTVLGSDTGHENDYIELDEQNLQSEPQDAAVNVRFATIREQQQVMAVKDAIYEKDIIVCDLSGGQVENMKKKAAEQFRTCVKETGGDIVKAGEDTLVIAPPSVNLSRNRIE